jgi:hypothetical protein
MSDDIEDLLGRMKPSGVPADLRPQVLAAVSADLTATGLKIPPCNHPAGHRFVCVHCGAITRPASRARRWAATAALTAMSSAAAVLLIIVVADRQTRIAYRSDGSAPTNSTTGVQPALVGATPRDNGGPTVNLSDSPRFALIQRSDGQRILSAADIQLLDDRFAQSEPAAKYAAEAMVDIESSDARVRNGALLHSILNEAGGRRTNPSRPHSTDFPGSRS